jgi:hypothetical protein
MDSNAAAQLAYEAYGNDAGWVNYLGNPMPAWSDLPTDTKSHWRAATLCVIDLTERGMVSLALVPPFPRG